MQPFLRPIYFGLGIFAVTGLAFYVFAAGVTFPAVQPNAVTGVVGMFVGITETKFTAATNYLSVSNLCKTGNVVTPDGTVNNLNAHVCSAMEIINSYNNNMPAVQSTQGRAWFNNGPPGHNLTLSNDCGGWTDKTAGAFGSIWYFKNTPANDRALINPCDSNGYGFACCL